MAEEIIITGKTFEEAMAQAQSEYSGENVQYEILEMPKKGIFGIGASPAKIKVIIADDQEEDTDLSGIVASIKGLKVTTNKGGDESTPAEKPAQKKPAPEKKEKPAAPQNRGRKQNLHQLMCRRLLRKKQKPPPRLRR